MIVEPSKICVDIKASLVQAGLFSDSGNTWRISPEPYFLSQEETTFFHELGPHLLKFYSVLNRFYLDSVKGNFHPWIAEYLDAGKASRTDRVRAHEKNAPGIAWNNKTRCYTYRKRIYRHRIGLGSREGLG